ncbi:hypothetical protein VM1G_02372 [Cytospora mali]|uniref:Uncharacterized protein n=1 Tax=Cytospora mali TaxID=578113 RepID=A0A194VNZ1_CYTMA|nr:hypothetical protein VM1G_02372 [Valsa mali]
MDDPFAMNLIQRGDRTILDTSSRQGAAMPSRHGAQSNAWMPSVQDPVQPGSSRLPAPASLPTPKRRTTVPKPAPPATPGASPDHTLTQMISGLDAKVLRDLIIKLAPSDPLLARAVEEAHREQATTPSQHPSALEQPRRSTRPAIPLSKMQPVINFDAYSKSAWHALNDRKVLGLSGSHQYDAAGDVYDRICGCISAIGEKTRDDSPLGTKQSAIETLRKIAKTIILGEETVGHEVRKELQCDSDIADIIIRILESMTPEERIRTGKKADDKGTLISKFEWVLDEAEGYCLEGLNGLDRALDMMETGLSSPRVAQGSSSAPIDLTC